MMASRDHTPLPPAGGVGGGRFKPRDTTRARTLRNEASLVERRLWRALSNRKLNGHKFSRQMPIGPYFADFLCRDLNVVVEVDGQAHENRQAYDQKRDSFMADQGFLVLRFTAQDVTQNLDGVLQSIANELEGRCPPPAPPASGRGESEIG
jgi:very-short-patch-repair endonuclease